MTGNENAANIMLQHLVREVLKLWRGEQSEIKNAWDACELCYAIGEVTIGRARRAAESHADDEIKLTREDVENAEEIDFTGAECRPLTDEEMLDGWCADIPHADTPEYKMWGNGMALPNALYIMQGFAAKAEKEEK